MHPKQTTSVFQVALNCNRCGIPRRSPVKALPTAPVLHIPIPTSVAHDLLYCLFALSPRHNTGTEYNYTREAGFHVFLRRVRVSLEYISSISSLSRYCGKSRHQGVGEPSSLTSLLHFAPTQGKSMARTNAQWADTLQHRVRPPARHRA